MKSPKQDLLKKCPKKFLDQILSKRSFFSSKKIFLFFFLLQFFPKFFFLEKIKNLSPKKFSQRNLTKKLIKAHFLQKLLTFSSSKKKKKNQEKNQEKNFPAQKIFNDHFKSKRIFFWISPKYSPPLQHFTLKFFIIEIQISLKFSEKTLINSKKSKHFNY